MNHATARTIGLALTVALVSGIATAAAQTERYPRMAPVSAYLMERDAEIRLARSAAPDSISGAATVLVLGPKGYETAITGRNGFVCMVARGWAAAFDWPEFWNPKIRAADCMNARAARFVVPVAMLRAKLVIAGRSKTEIRTAVQAAYTRRQLPQLTPGALSFMMSPTSYLTDESGQNMPHVMFYTAGMAAEEWGANAEKSPVMAAPYWFFLPHAPSEAKGLPEILVFLIMVPHWADGTPAGR